MASLQKVRSKGKNTLSTPASSSSETESVASSESSILPGTLATETDSLRLLKRMVASSLSTICYLRGVLAPEYFVDKKLPDGGTVKVLTFPTGIANPDRRALFLLDLINGALEAIEMKYLRAILFGISHGTNDPHLVHELYTFHIQYDDEPTVTGKKGNGKKKTAYISTKKMVTNVMRQIAQLVRELEPYSNNADFTMKLLYYDDRTPREYEPQGFSPTDRDDFQFTSPINTELAFGKVETKYHSMNVNVAAAINLDEANDDGCQIKK